MAPTCPVVLWPRGVFRFEVQSVCFSFVLLVPWVSRPEPASLQTCRLVQRVRGSGPAWAPVQPEFGSACGAREQPGLVPGLWAPRCPRTFAGQDVPVLRSEHIQCLPLGFSPLGVSKVAPFPPPSRCPASPGTVRSEQPAWISAGDGTGGLGSAPRCCLPSMSPLSVSSLHGVLVLGVCLLFSLGSLSVTTPPSCWVVSAGPSRPCRLCSPLLSLRTVLLESFLLLRAASCRGRCWLLSQGRASLHSRFPFEGDVQCHCHCAELRAELRTELHARVVISLQALLHPSRSSKHFH